MNTACKKYCISDVESDHNLVTYKTRITVINLKENIKYIRMQDIQRFHRRKRSIPNGVAEEAEVLQQRHLCRLRQNVSAVTGLWKKWNCIWSSIEVKEWSSIKCSTRHIEYWCWKNEKTIRKPWITQNMLWKIEERTPIQWVTED